jgi:hypothetical protein
MSMDIHKKKQGLSYRRVISFWDRLPCVFRYGSRWLVGVVGLCPVPLPLRI